MGADELDGEPTAYGTRGSPTFVREVRVHETERARGRTEDPADGAGRIHGLVRRSQEAAPVEWHRPRVTGERHVWVLVEHDGEALESITGEGLAAGREMAEPLDARVTAVLLGPAEVDVSAQLGAAGADRVLHVRSPLLRDYATAAYSETLATVLAETPPEHQPYVLVAPWTANGRDYVPRVAARLGLGLTGDATGVEVEAGEKPRVGWVKPAWAGTADALVISRTTPTVATVRPGSYQPLQHRDDAAAVAGQPEVEVRDVDLTVDERQPRLLGRRSRGGGHPGGPRPGGVLPRGRDVRRDRRAGGRLGRADGRRSRRHRGRRARGHGAGGGGVRDHETRHRCRPCGGSRGRRGGRVGACPGGRAPGDGAPECNRECSRVRGSAGGRGGGLAAQGLGRGRWLRRGRVRTG